MKLLEPPDSHVLSSAQGWLELGNWQEADAELNQITPENQAHPAVLLVRFEISSKAKQWNRAAEIAGTLAGLLPNEPGVWIGLAFSTRRMAGGGIPKAKEILLAAEKKFATEWLFPFNLACYCSQLREFPEAEQWLKKAMDIDQEKVQLLAMQDDDLKPLWESMGGRNTKKE